VVALSVRGRTSCYNRSREAPDETLGVVTHDAIFFSSAGGIVLYCLRVSLAGLSFAKASASKTATLCREARHASVWKATAKHGMKHLVCVMDCAAFALNSYCVRVDA
jgi:hypothetical protein